MLVSNVQKKTFMVGGWVIINHKFITNIPSFIL